MAEAWSRPISRCPASACFPQASFWAAIAARPSCSSDFRRGTYKKLVIEDGRLTGAVLVGDTADALWYLEMIRKREKIAGVRKDMMFGRPACNAGCGRMIGWLR